MRPELSVVGTKDAPQLDADWVARRDLIDGVQLREIRSVVTGNGITTEVWRPDWLPALPGLEQVIHVRLRPGALSAWHLHRERYDAVLVVGGHLRLVAYDARTGSPTHGQVDVLHLSEVRPTLVLIPPAIWHGIQVLGDAPASFVNCFDRSYAYDDPDEWRLPADSDEIPYSFA